MAFSPAILPLPLRERVPTDLLHLDRGYFADDQRSARLEAACWQQINRNRLAAHSDAVRVFVNMPQSDVSRVQAGSSATVKVDEYPNETFSGKVARDAGAFDQASRTVLLEVDVPNPNGRLDAGMYARVTLSTPDPQPLLYVPDSRLSPSDLIVQNPTDDLRKG